MKTNKIRRFAAIAVAAAIAAGMSGNAVRAGAVNHTAVYKEGHDAGKRIPFNLKRGGITATPPDKDSELCKVGGSGGVKLCIGSCLDGQAKIMIYTENKKYTFTVPESDSIWKTYYIPAPKGSTVYYSVAPDFSAGYRSAKGYFEVYNKD